MNTSYAYSVPGSALTNLGALLYLTLPNKSMRKILPPFISGRIVIKNKQFFQGHIIKWKRRFQSQFFLILKHIYSIKWHSGRLKEWKSEQWNLIRGYRKQVQSIKKIPVLLTKILSVTNRWTIFHTVKILFLLVSNINTVWEYFIANDFIIRTL